MSNPLPKGKLSHFPLPPRVVAREQALYVPPGFAGKCKVFPRPAENGKCPFLLGYQSDWVLDESRIKDAEKSRQIGFSWCTSYRAVRKAAQKKAPLDWWISSRDEIQARLFLDDCVAFAEVYAAGAKDLGERVVDEDGHTASVLRFANGRAINSMSSNPNAQAGKRGPRVLDELALHADPRKLYDIAYPGITWGGSLEMISTHRGTANFFNQQIVEIRETENKKGTSLHRITIEDALAHGFLYKLQTKLPEGDPRQAMDEADYFNYIRAGCSDEESFLQEYMCQPGDDASAFLSYDLIAGCWHKSQNDFRIDHITDDKHGKELPIKVVGNWKIEDATGPLYIGYDVGRKHDLTVITVCELLGGRMLVRLIIEMERAPFARQEAELFPLLRHRLTVRCCGDATGIGAQLAERAQTVAPGKVEAIVFTPAMKDELATPVRPAFEDKTLIVPNDGKLTSDLRGIRKLATTGANIRYDGDRGPNGHSDRFWAIALARHAAKTGQTEYRIILT